jgi:hypothetical protein
MEFVKTSHFIQTEMHLKVMNSTKSVNHQCDENFDEASTSDAIRVQSSSTSSSLAVPDHTTLIMPIHQKICHILIDFLTQTNHNYHSCVSNDDNNFRHDTTSTFTSSSPLSSSSTALTASTAAVVRIALIGAGCCAIPAYLLSKHSQRDTNNQQRPHQYEHQHQQYLRFSFDAIEPEAQILDIATKYFGINFDNTYLTKHVMDGLSFLKAAISVPSSSYDVIVVDAFSNQSSVENHFAASSSHHIKGKLLCT